MLAVMLTDIRTPDKSANDGVVVLSKLSCLDSGLEFHTILLVVFRGLMISGARPHFAAVPPPEH
jgi:hypothetical protein